MLNVFTLVQGRLVQQEIESPQSLASESPVWVDLESPSPLGWAQLRCRRVSLGCRCHC